MVASSPTSRGGSSVAQPADTTAAAASGSWATLASASGSAFPPAATDPPITVSER